VLVIQALRQQGLSVGVYKPVESGCARDGKELIAADALALWKAADRPGQLDRVCPQRFEAPLSADEAARREGREVDPELLRDGFQFWRGDYDFVVVEGAGGLMSPVAKDIYVGDLALEFDLPLLVVSANVLGTINQTLQTLLVADCLGDGLRIAGVVLNDVRADNVDDPSRETNYRQLVEHCRVPVLEHVGWQATRLQGDWIKSL
jgi:dethiobiotin synthetase